MKVRVERADDQNFDPGQKSVIYSDLTTGRTRHSYISPVYRDIQSTSCMQSVCMLQWMKGFTKDICSAEN
ncbi:hypothetical protein PHYPO_G00047200 [Pangasianodon hypophthalmus]|uniref:Uncharacterized protein n=1 Tax=Pangasianodon hypophthalmus TaxID=310915 RepID=A0A5N5MG93_PANHP|nr:hypothetical protein PHYPO_G00047200 [Pangasianodon hypophthalmus]